MFGTKSMNGSVIRAVLPLKAPGKDLSVPLQILEDSYMLYLVTAPLCPLPILSYNISCMLLSHKDTSHTKLKAQYAPV